MSALNTRRSCCHRFRWPQRGLHGKDWHQQCSPRLSEQGLTSSASRRDSRGLAIRSSNVSGRFLTFAGRPDSGTAYGDDLAVPHRA